MDKQLISVLTEARARNYPGVIDAIALLDKRGRRADASLLRLLDYYVGEGPTLELDEAITKRGKRMLEPLLARRNSKLNCLPDFMQVCMSRFSDGISARNEHISHLVDAVRSGVVLRPEKQR